MNKWERSSDMHKQTKQYGILGRSLKHTYSPIIYRELTRLSYQVFEREPQDIEAFVRSTNLNGFNVTIPYKRKLFELCDEVSDIARRLGNVNTVVRTSDGRLFGDNTDYFGFKTLVNELPIDVFGKKALVFGGHGGAGTTVCAVLDDMGLDVVSVGRTSSTTYEDLACHSEAKIAVNCTPVGMYPNCPALPCSLDDLNNLEAVLDIVYNPARTALMMEAEQRKIYATGGLMMLVAQAAQAIELYTGETISKRRIVELTQKLSATTQNITLIGMPGSGKTTVGKLLAKLLNRPFVDIDEQIANQTGMSCQAYILKKGEQDFRVLEHEVLQKYGSKSGQVIASGGGVVVRADNYPLLHQNSRIVMLDRPLDELSCDGRPLSMQCGIQELANKRMELYRMWADQIIQSRASADETARALYNSLPSMLDINKLQTP